MEKKEDLFAAPNQQPKPVKKKGNPIAIIIAVVALLGLAIFVVRPAVLGYGIYQQAESSNLSVQDYAQNMQQLSRDLELTQTNLSSYSVFTGALLAQVEEKNDELTECKVALEGKQSEIDAAQQQVADKDAEIAKVKDETQQIVDQQVAEKTAALEQEKAACEASLVVKETEVSEIQAQYDLVVQNSAKNICCKAKVDNPQINFYEVVDGKITCLEQGSTELNC